MQYAQIMQGVFRARPNRFIAHVEIAGREEIVHVKNTGRCKELLLPGAMVYVQYFPAGKRKTKYDLIAVEKVVQDGVGEQQTLLINMDSQAPNKVVQEWLEREEPFGKMTYLKPECRHGASRFDFYLETATKKMFIEVKGVTLEENGVVLFPDAPTERGVKHVQELCHCLEQGYEAAIVFVVQMRGMRYFTPNRRTHAAFAEALEQAAASGVQLMALTCAVTPDSLIINVYIWQADVLYFKQLLLCQVLCALVAVAILKMNEVNLCVSLQNFLLLLREKELLAMGILGFLAKR